MHFRVRIDRMLSPHLEESCGGRPGVARNQVQCLFYHRTHIRQPLYSGDVDISMKQYGSRDAAKLQGPGYFLRGRKKTLHVKITVM